MYIYGQSFFPMDIKLRIASVALAPHSGLPLRTLQCKCIYVSFFPVDCELLEGQDLSPFPVSRTWPGA
uniref:Uncharacterized protein n=1 Tax=Ailuropoda melanoleuca TaxID=9646 RepID=A0A7N5JE51_AILME